MKPANGSPNVSGGVDDILTSVEDAVRRAYALGRSDAMKRVMELAQSDDPTLRAVALLGSAEPARPAPAPAMLEGPKPASAEQPRHQEAAAEAADAEHEAREAEAVAAGASPSTAPAPAQPESSAASPRSEQVAEPRREEPKTVGGFLADYFYPIGSKKR